MTKKFDARNAEKSRAVCEAMAERADTGKRVLTEREQRILDMWPRYEDGDPVMIGDEVDGFGGEIIDVYIAENAAAIWNNYGNHMHLSLGERVNRPAPKVLDADGVPIHEGDTVWIIPAVTDTPDEPHEVKHINRWGEVLLEFHFERSTGVKGEYLTHTRPDSWERLEEDAADLDDMPCDFNAKDLIRRAKALAGAEAGR